MDVKVKKIKGCEAYGAYYKGLLYYKHADKDIVNHFAGEFQVLIERCGDDFIGELKLIAVADMQESQVI